MPNCLRQHPISVAIIHSARIIGLRWKLLDPSSNYVTKKIPTTAHREVAGIFYLVYIPQFLSCFDKVPHKPDPAPTISGIYPDPASPPSSLVALHTAIRAAIGQRTRVIFRLLDTLNCKTSHIAWVRPPASRRKRRWSASTVTERRRRIFPRTTNLRAMGCHAKKFTHASVSAQDVHRCKLICVMRRRGAHR